MEIKGHSNSTALTKFTVTILRQHFFLFLQCSLFDPHLLFNSIFQISSNACAYSGLSNLALSSEPSHIHNPPLPWWYSLVPILFFTLGTSQEYSSPPSYPQFHILQFVMTAVQMTILPLTYRQKVKKSLMLHHNPPSFTSLHLTIKALYHFISPTREGIEYNKVVVWGMTFT